MMCAEVLKLARNGLNMLDKTVCATEEGKTHSSNVMPVKRREPSLASETLFKFVIKLR
eukprot:NODE_1811_length_2368_cov_58.736278.p11 GENE.NODE_1811_length_2368_cov_58.736278~~NODE_1811_length_2368_cov_58.736278.p11  ORF type:complete len:58 (-),score=2.97 NODE_1811_length_2368_cov_58.736278:284-457(-)